MNSIDSDDDSNIKLNKGEIKIYSNKSLGDGSYSKVYLGKYRNNQVAVKIISTKSLEQNIATQLERELDIIQILQNYPHKNIASYYKIINTYDKMIIVMELCSEGELSKHIHNGLSFDSIQSYFKQILSGYHHLLELNIVHRDIKSANILLNNDKTTIKFIDFGLSKINNNDFSRTICGSPLYMAPELLNSEDYDSRSDIWSLGVLLYEMVYGLTPFHNCKAIKTLKEQIQLNKIEFPEFSAKNIFKVPTDLIDYMKKLLEVNPNKRISWDDISRSAWLNNLDDNEIFDDYFVERSKPVPIVSTSPSKPISIYAQASAKIISPRVRNKQFICESVKNVDFFDLNNYQEDNEIELIDINDIDDNMITNTPDKSTAFEYISKKSINAGSYIYSKSAPIAIGILGKIGKIGKTSKKILKIITPK